MSTAADRPRCSAYPCLPARVPQARRDVFPVHVGERDLVMRCNRPIASGAPLETEYVLFLAGGVGRGGAVRLHRLHVVPDHRRHDELCRMRVRAELIVPHFEGVARVADARLKADAVQLAHQFEVLSHRRRVTRRQRMLAENGVDVAADFHLRRGLERVGCKRGDLRRHIGSCARRTVRSVFRVRRARAEKRDHHREAYDRSARPASRARSVRSHVPVVVRTMGQPTSARPLSAHRARRH